MFWSLGADAKELCFEQVEDSPSTSPITVLSLKGGVERSRDEVRTVMKLGITHLAPGTLRWLSDDAFEAESTGEFGRIDGRITEWKNGAPARLEYDVQKVPGHKFVVRYGYPPNRGFPPAEIALSDVRSGKETASGTCAPAFPRKIEPSSCYNIINREYAGPLHVARDLATPFALAWSFPPS